MTPGFKPFTVLNSMSVCVELDKPRLRGKALDTALENLA